jgi:histidinol phosphatase-like PHP family hydrolase
MTLAKLVTNQVIFKASQIWGVDLRVENQVHTSWTDGKNSVPEMENSAQRNDLRVLVFTEHTSSDSGNWFPNFVHEVNSLPISELEIYVGTEVRIKDFSGGIDLNEDVEQLSQVILASVHRFPDKAGKPIEFSSINHTSSVCDTELALMSAAIRTKRAHIIAHPFGMSLRRYNQKPTVLHWEKLIEVATEHEVALEFNSKYHQDDFSILERYIGSDCLISLGSDAHSIYEVGECSKKVIKFLGL